MVKLISVVSTVIVIMIAGSAAAGVVLTDENLDTITAGATNTDVNSMSIMLPGVTLVGQCIGTSCNITVNGEICNSCQLVVNQSGVTMTDASGRCMRWPMIWPSSTLSMALVGLLRL